MNTTLGVAILYVVIGIVMLSMVVLAVISAGVGVEWFFGDIIAHRRKVQDAKLWERRDD